jgi:hypothetical protein
MTLYIRYEKQPYYYYDVPSTTATVTDYPGYEFQQPTTYYTQQPTTYYTQQPTLYYAQQPAIHNSQQPTSLSTQNKPAQG